ncbi:anaphase-promoting complex subunit 2-like isoform X2 [Dysidea avara]
MDDLYKILRALLSIKIPQSFGNTMKDVVSASFDLFSSVSGKVDDSNMDDNESDAGDEDGRWTLFTEIVTDMRSLKLLHFFMESAVKSVLHGKIRSSIEERCSQEYESSLLAPTVSYIKSHFLSWLQVIFEMSFTVSNRWSDQLEYYSYKSFAELRIKELFDIIVEYPDSKPAIDDLKVCLDQVEMKTHLMESLRQSFEQRLLHPGANTADIISQYISAIRSLKVLDPSGVVVEKVCQPIKDYLRQREDSVRCIVANLVDSSGNELAQELASKSSALMDLNEDSENEEEDFDNWVPDPVDADPTKSSRSRQTTDIISILVNIYGSKEMFINEYRQLLAERLLQMTDYDTTGEVYNLELLKLKFGEANLNFCEVMIKDVADSRRINASLQAASLNNKDATATGYDGDFNALILSYVFWPAYKEENIILPDPIRQKMAAYCKQYEALKGMRTLKWIASLGVVKLDLELAGRTQSFSVSPARAAVIYHFENQACWKTDDLRARLAISGTALRKHLNYWSNQGVLREHPVDTFTIVEEQEDNVPCSSHVEMDDERESVMMSAEEQKENDLQVFWPYIIGMLTNLGKMSQERIHSMLKMFAMQGANTQECSMSDLKAFLDRKVKEHQLSYAAGTYQLVQSKP